MLNAVIIVLREVLEAALLVSVLLSLSKIRGLSLSWFIWAFAAGVSLGILFAFNMEYISKLRDYTGQELMNGSIQLLTYLFALLSLLATSSNRPAIVRVAPVLSIITVALAMTREGAEIFIYLQGATIQGDVFPVVTGTLIGTAIGTSAGIIVFYTLTLNRRANALLFGQCLLAVVATGLLGQVVPLFEQIDLIPFSASVWNTSAFLPEDSILGQLMYAIAGYEATPSTWHASTWLVGLLLFAIVIVAIHFHGAKNAT